MEVVNGSNVREILTLSQDSISHRNPRLTPWKPFYPRLISSGVGFGHHCHCLEESRSRERLETPAFIRVIRVHSWVEGIVRG